MEKTLGKILIIDDDEDVLLAGKMFLKKHAKEVIIEQNPKKIPFLLNHDTYDVILLDMNFSQDTTSGKEGFMWLKEIMEREPKSVVIMITAFGDVEMAVRALKEGATDFVLKPWQNEKLLATISAASRLKASYNEVNELMQQSKQLSDDLSQPYKTVIGESPAMKQIFNLIDKVAETDANVLILGENGTGKEVIARAIHQRSLRRDKVLVGVDMGAIPETLFESELFGHKKGAFTDAKDDRVGRFEVANKGTLFLDEIGNLSMPMQSKLLSVLQNREFTRVGANKPIPMDVRLISATNMPLYEMVKDHKFRQDLVYRINTVEIHLPPLRERREDIPLLSEHFAAMYAKKYRKSGISCSAALISFFKEYHWPGNIRELQHAIERGVIMSDGKTLKPEDFSFLQLQQEAEAAKIPTLNLDDVERSAVEKAMNKHEGNISKAARELGLTRASLYRRLEKYGL
jgi:DNA-binding NtrC family response regulator